MFYGIQSQTQLSFSIQIKPSFLVSLTPLMDPSYRSVVGSHLYTDFEPNCVWTEDERTHTLHVDIPGFKKEYLKVQIDSNGNLKVAGERPMQPFYENKWSRFRKMFRVPENCNANQIKAKFENDVLFVIIPKIIKTDDAFKPQENQVAKKPELDEVKSRNGKSPLKMAGKEEEDLKGKDVVDDDDDDKTTKDEPQSLIRDKSSYITIGRRITGSFRYGSEKLGLKSERSRKMILSVMIIVLLLLGAGFYINRRFNDCKELAVISDSN